MSWLSDDDDDDDESAASAESRDGALWVYESGSGHLVLWVPHDAVEAVSPLDERSVEIRYASGTGAWSRREKAARTDSVVFRASDSRDASRLAALLVDGLGHVPRGEAPSPRGAIMRTLAGRQLASSRRSAPETPNTRRLRSSFWEPRGRCTQRRPVASTPKKPTLNGKHQRRAASMTRPGGGARRRPSSGRRGIRNAFRAVRATRAVAFSFVKDTLLKGVTCR